MKQEGVLVALLVVLSVSLLIQAWGMFWQRRYQYFVFSREGGEQIMRVEENTGLPEYMMADRVTHNWCYASAPPVLLTREDSLRARSGRIGGIYGD